MPLSFMLRQVELLMALISELCGLTCRMGSQGVTWHPTHVNIPHLNQFRHASTRLTYPGGMEGWVELVGWLHTVMVYLSKDSHQRVYCISVLLFCFCSRRSVLYRQSWSSMKKVRWK